MNPIDECLLMKQAGFRDLARGVWRGLSGGTDASRVFDAAQAAVKTQRSTAAENMRAATAAFGKSRSLGAKALADKAVRDFNSIKDVAPPKGFDALARGYELGGKLQAPIAIAGTALALAGATLAVRKVYGAMTKQRDFKQMMDVAPDLGMYHEENPKLFNQTYTSMRNVNPAYASDPLIASSLMRKMMAGPEQAGMTLAEVSKDRLKPSEFKAGPFGIK